MRKDHFDKLLAGMEDALAYAQGDTSRGVTHVVTQIDVAAIRKKTGLSQGKFAEKFGFAKSAVQQWEQKRRIPERSAKLLLRIIETNPSVVEEAARLA